MMRYRQMVFFWRCRLLLLMILFPAVLQAQLLSTKKKKVIELYKNADQYRVTGQYQQAVPLLETAIKKDPKFIDAYFMLGILYKSMRNFSRSTEILQAGYVYAQYTEKGKGFLFELGDNYLRQGNYQQARTYLEKYLRGAPTTKKKTVLAHRLKQNAVYGLTHKKEWPLNRPRLLSGVVNRFLMQYFPVLTADEQALIYTRRVHANPGADEDLVISKKNMQGNWTPPISLSKNINSTSNEGTCTISADGRLLIFTSCSGREVYGSCDLFFSEKTHGQWSSPVNMGSAINSDAWESQPAMSADGMELYFTSEREGGYGGKDIYYSRRGEDGEWLPARNVGASINTAYDEISPFLHTNGRAFFFASNGRVGFGGYDLYESARQEGGWGEVLNMGSLINDYEDQFSLFVSSNGEKAYYSYEKGAYRNVSKLVEIDIPEELRIHNSSRVLKGIVRDERTGEPLFATIELFDLKKRKRASFFKSDAKTGQYLVTTTHGTEYALYVNAPGYLFKSLHVDTVSAGALQEVDIDLRKEVVGSETVLNNLFFSINQYELSKKSKVELDQLVDYMKKNPRMQIEIGGHTDNVGADTYNKALSLKRAHIVAVYLVNKGINKHRLLEKGYGSSQPLRSNDTEGNRRINRRTSFKIVALK